MATFLYSTGIESVIRTFGKKFKEDVLAVKDGMHICGQRLLELAQEYVPKDTWALHDTGRYHIEGSGITANAVVEFGGRAPGHDVPVDYAAIVHNDLTAYHEPPTCALYLEKATREMRGLFASIIGRRIAKDTINDTINDETSTRRQLINMGLIRPSRKVAKPPRSRVVYRHPPR